MHLVATPLACLLSRHEVADPIHGARMLRIMTFLALLVSTLGASASAQSFPEKPMTMVVSYAAGGPSDVIARLLAQYMATSLGQPIQIENVSGAGGTAGAARAAKAQPDGHTLLIHHVALALGPSLYAKLPYDTLTAFEPIGLVNTNPFVLTSKKDMPASTAKEVLAYIKANANKVTFGHAGVGSGSHLCDLLLQTALGVKLAEVPYRGNAPAMNDLVAGQLDFMFDQTISAVPQIAAGTVKAFAVTSLGRNAQLKDVPSLHETGLKDYEVTQWHALYAPAGTPQGALARLSAALEKALREPAVAARFAELGSELFPEGRRGPAETKAMLAAEHAKWANVIKAAGLSPN